MEFKEVDNIILCVLCLLAIALSISLGILYVQSNQNIQYVNLPQTKLEGKCALHQQI